MPFTRRLSTLTPLWFFLILFKMGACLHYTLIIVLGSRILPAWVVGLASGGAALLQLALDIPAGFVIERYGTTKTLGVSTLAFIAAALVLIVGGLSPFTYALSLLLSALGWQFLTPSASAYLLSNVHPSVMGRASSYQNMAEALGATLALAGLSVYTTLPVALLGLIMLYPFLGACAALLFLSKHETIHPESYHRLRRHTLRTSLKTLVTLFYNLRPAALLLASWGLVTSIFYGVLWVIIPLFIAQGGSPVLGIGLAVFDLTVLFIGFISGWLADQKKKRLLILTCLLTTSILALTLGVALSWLFIPLAFLISFGDEIVIDTSWAWLDSLRKDEKGSGIISGAITFSQDIGWAIGPILGGILFSFLSATHTFFFAALPLCVVAILACFWLHKSHQV